MFIVVEITKLKVEIPAYVLCDEGQLSLPKSEPRVFNWADGRNNGVQDLDTLCSCMKLPKSK